MILRHVSSQTLTICSQILRSKVQTGTQLSTKRTLRGPRCRLSSSSSGYRKVESGGWRKRSPSSLSIKPALTAARATSGTLAWVSHLRQRLSKFRISWPIGTPISVLLARTTPQMHQAGVTTMISTWTIQLILWNLKGRPAWWVGTNRSAPVKCPTSWSQNKSRRWRLIRKLTTKQWN